MFFPFSSVSNQTYLLRKNRYQLTVFDRLNSYDIYSIFRTQLLKIDLDLRIPVGVYVVSRLFERPCFRRELKLIGITQKHLDQYLEKPGIVCELPDSHLKKARSDITRIEIPPDDPAYEIREPREEVTRLANEVLAGLIKHRIDLEGLLAKSKQTTFSTSLIFISAQTRPLDTFI